MRAELEQILFFTITVLPPMVCLIVLIRAQHKLLLSRQERIDQLMDTMLGMQRMGYVAVAPEEREPFVMDDAYDLEVQESRLAASGRNGASSTPMRG